MTLELEGLKDFDEVDGEVVVKEINNHDIDEDYEV